MRSDLDTERLAQSLRNLTIPGDSLVVIGGSAITPWATPTSDLDLLVVGSRDLAGAAGRSTGWARPVDVEVRDAEWLCELARQLEAFSPRATGGPSPFDFFDLRFLARLLLGRVVIGSPPENLSEPLRVALADYFSTWWGATYRDVLGLYLSKRPDEALVLVGELAQRACTVALLQLDLIDPAPKWALHRCLKDDRLSGAAQCLFRALRCNTPDRAWLRDLLLASNQIVAESRRRQVSVTERGGDLGTPSVEWCILGRPGLNMLLDASSGRIMIYNNALLASYSQ